MTMAQDGPSTTPRGRDIVATRVVEKIAAQSAWEIAGTAGRSGGFLGFGGHGDASKRPKVSAELAGDVAVLQVELGIGFPAPVRRLVHDVQETLTREVGRMAGVAVSRVDVEVIWMSVDSHADSRSANTQLGEHGRGELL